MIPTLINAHPRLFMMLCWVTLILALAAGGAWLGRTAWTRPRGLAARVEWRWQWAFLSLLALSVVLFRQPTLWRSDCQQIDATCVLVAAQMLQADPVPWRGCTIGIHGPLEAYTLMPFYWLGFAPVPATARLYALLCVLVLVMGTGATLARLGGAGAAVPATLAAGLWAAFAKEMNAFEWNSEYLPAALLVLAVWLYARARAAGRLVPLWLACAGLLLGAVPYAKLQAVPPALVLTLVGALDLACSAVWAGRRRRSLLTLGLGGLALPLIFTSITLATGTWQDFVLHYFAFARGYGSATAPALPVLESLAGFDTPWLLLFGGWVAVSFMLLAGWRDRPRPPHYGWWLSGAGLYLLAALYAINTARMGYHHYAILLVPPLVLLMGLLTGPAWAAMGQSWLAARPGRLAGGFAVLALGVGGWVYAYQTGGTLQVSHPAQPLYGWSTARPGLQQFLPIPRDTAIYSTATCQLARQLASAAQSPDRLAVWGWAPQYFLETGMPNATRYLITVGQMVPGSWVRLPPAVQSFYRERYLEDLQRHRPEWFIDAVSDAEFVFHDRAQYGHESWPALRDYVAANYLQVGDLPSAPGNATRVYLRRDLHGTRGSLFPLR